MPNLVPPVLTSADAVSYRNRILNEVPSNRSFDPLMTLYLTDQTSKKTITEAAKSSIIHACKLYPAGATTHSDAGVNTIEGLYPIFEEMQKTGLRLAIHGEVTDSKVDIFDRSNPTAPSVIDIWRGADYQEREIYDLMGIQFKDHPNLKRLLLWEGFDGHPLRKDYLEPPLPYNWPQGG